jgi:uncharacterized protein
MRKKIVLVSFYLFVLCFWGWVFLAQDGIELVIRYWYLPLTMAFGSFVAGATSEGGGAIAFPVLTLVLSISPTVARDFSLLIQSVGMSAASLWIWKMEVPIERQAILYGTLGGGIGIFVGLVWIQGIFSAAYIKMFFVCTWLAFGWVLLVQRKVDRVCVRSSLPHLDSSKRFILLFAAVLGGIVSSLTGSGLDIFMFSVLTLYFRVSEKVATPTSVVLMALNSLIGVSLTYVLSSSGILQPSHPLAINFWITCVPVVIIGAPLGAFFIKNKSRNFIIGLLLGSIVLQFSAGILIVPHNTGLMLFDLSVFLTAFFLFRKMKSQADLIYSNSKPCSAS